MENKDKIIFCKQLLNGLGRYSKIKILKNSNLTNRERRVLYLRFVEGLSIKECSDYVGLELSSFNKLQHRIFLKFYDWVDYNLEDLRQLFSIPK